jgi:hypothetical protein
MSNVALNVHNMVTLGTDYIQQANRKLATTGKKGDSEQFSGRQKLLTVPFFPFFACCG